MNNVFIELMNELDVTIKEPLIENRKYNNRTYNNRTSGIYLITDGEYCKIGVAGNVDNRMKELQTGNARRLSVLYYTKLEWFVANTNESKLHKLFKDKRLVGEWFNLNKEDIDYIIDYLDGL